MSHIFKIAFILDEESVNAWDWNDLIDNNLRLGILISN